MEESCKVCDKTRREHFRATVLGKYLVRYFYCDHCGVIQAERPYWSKEAYNSAIADADTGLLARNFSTSRVLARLLYFLFDPAGMYLDVAGGYGVLTRLMRDFGFEFYWSDDYCQNIFAKGFDLVQSPKAFTAVTAIEVLEHIDDPVRFIDDWLKRSASETIIFTTELFGPSPPAPAKWWYYQFETGQHISFYQARTFRYIGKRLGLRFYTFNNLHMLTRDRASPTLFRILNSRLSAPLTIWVQHRMKSKTVTDHKAIIDRV